MRFMVGIGGIALMLVGLAAGPVLAAESGEVAAALREARVYVAPGAAYAAAYDEALREQLTSGTDLPFDVADFDLQRWLPWIIGGFLVLSVLGRLLRPRGRRYGRGRHVGRRRGGGMLGAAVGGRALGGARRSGTTRARSSSRSAPRSRSSGSRRGGASRRR